MMLRFSYGFPGLGLNNLCVSIRRKYISSASHMDRWGDACIHGWRNERMK